MKRAIATWGLIAASACTDRSEGVKGSVDRPIEMLVTNDAETLDPRYVTDAVGMRTTRLVHAGLTRTDPGSLRPIPYLAESLVWADPLTLDVRLREGIHFHGGAAFAADDVVATLLAFGAESVASRHAGTVEPIASVVATSPRDVRIVLKRPHATLLSDLDLPILRRDQAAGPPDPGGESLDGLGPFEIEHATRGEIVLRPARAGALLAHDRVVVRTVHDENARALRLYSGRADIALNAISPTLLPALGGLAASGGAEGGEGALSIATSPGANLTYLVARVDRGPLADVALRRAISLAIDRRMITASLFGGRASPADSLFAAGHWAFTEGVPLAFDPSKARAIAQESPPPRRLALLTSTDRLRITVARTLAQELAAAGIDVEVVPLELGTLIARLNAGDFDLASLQLPELTEPNTLRVFLHSDDIPPAGANRGRVRDAEVDALLDEGDAVQGERERAQLYARLEKRLRDQLFIIPLWHEDQVAVVSARAKGFHPSPDGRWLSLADLR